MTCHDYILHRNVNKGLFCARWDQKILILKGTTRSSCGSMLKIPDNITGWLDEMPNITSHKMCFSQLKRLVKLPEGIFLKWFLVYLWSVKICRASSLHWILTSTNTTKAWKRICWYKKYDILLLNLSYKG